MQVPLVNTIVTVTSCRLYTLSYAHFRSAMNAYPELCEELQETVNKCMLNARFEESVIRSDEQTIVMGSRQQDRSFVHFGYKLPPNTPEYAAYHNSFDNLGYWGFIRYILLRTTFTSYGKFLWYWDISR